ncbi:unnamed protein product [Blepharisma stoltei]|uniref:Uncharacterized protein n=1 Tax=Blepharisma stoltei TaxID=1481888 RepID=A0AAU9KD33_9CILI|nr:unnamed protein product [Blepharisma stoltei]
MLEVEIFEAGRVEDVTDEAEISEAETVGDLTDEVEIFAAEIVKSLIAEALAWVDIDGWMENYCSKMKKLI